MNTPVCPILPFDKHADQLFRLDLSESNIGLSPDIFGDIQQFSEYMDGLRAGHHARYLVGGYAELRKVYSFSSLFDGSASEPRRLHLGLDIWGPAGTPVFAPVQGWVHSAAWNGAKGDYGGTLILRHETQEGLTWHTLYGHLDKATVESVVAGQLFQAGDQIGRLGGAEENGGWPPHLHFQIVLDMEGMEGDYPGVCRFSEREKYLSNCPDPEELSGVMMEPVA